MASELVITASFSYAKGVIAPYSESLAASLTRDVAGLEMMKNTQTVGTVEEAILLGDVASPGYMFCKNLDPTNFVSIRPGTGTANCIKLNPGDVAIFRCSAAPWAIADTAPCILAYTVIEN